MVHAGGVGSADSRSACRQMLRLPSLRRIPEASSCSHGWAWQVGLVAKETKQVFGGSTCAVVLCLFPFCSCKLMSFSCWWLFPPLPSFFSSLPCSLCYFFLPVVSLSFVQSPVSRMACQTVREGGQSSFGRASGHRASQIETRASDLLCGMTHERILRWCLIIISLAYP